MTRIPSNWGLAPSFGADDLLFDGPAPVRRVSAADAARAIGVPLSMLQTNYSEAQIVNLTDSQWRDYRKVLESRGVSGREIVRLSDARNIASLKSKGNWTAKRGYRKQTFAEGFHEKSRDTLHTVASSPITQGALAVAAFTPLAPIAVPVGVGLSTADRLARGERLDVAGLTSVAASALGVPPGAVPVAGQLGRLAAGELDVQGLGVAAARAVGVPPGAVRVGTQLARGDVKGLGYAAAAELGVPPGAVRVASQVSRGDLRGASKALPVPKTVIQNLSRARQLHSQAKSLQYQARNAPKRASSAILRAARPVPPSPGVVRSLLRRRWF